MKPVLTLAELNRYIDKLPNSYDPERQGPRYEMAIYPEPSSVLMYEMAYRAGFDRPIDITRLVFTARTDTVLGKRVTAWLYGDVLVKVSV